MATKAKPRLLLIEFGSHLLGLQEIARMLEPEWRLVFAIRHQNKLGSWRDEFGNFSQYSRSLMMHAELPRLVYSVTSSRWLARIIGDSLFYGRILWMILFSRKVLITTGPEHRGKVEIAILWLVVFLRRGRVILNVRDGGDYIKALNFETRDGWSWAVASLFRRVTRISFETEGVRRTFSSLLRSDSITGVIPWMMSDTVFKIQKKTTAQPEVFFFPILIGVLGTIDSSRRDYETLLNALDQLSYSEREKLKFVFLAGPPQQTETSELRKRITDLVQTEFPVETGFLQAYLPTGVKCNALLAPLRYEAGYGKTKGSGAFGDMLALRKKIIVPETCDPMQEFSAFSYYYRDSSDLAGILQSIIGEPLSKLTVEQIDYEQWSAPSVYKRIAPLFS